MTSESPKTKVRFEPLESRTFLSAAPTVGALNDSLSPLNVVYVESNNPNAGQNAVLAFERDGSTGAHTLLGKFNTGGTGFVNADDRLGPEDNDRPIVVTHDRKFLFAVNGGDNTITSFRVGSDGTLIRVTNGVHSSGGFDPVSLEVVGDKLYVLNKGNVGPTDAGDVAANIAVLRIKSNGALAATDAAKITFSGEHGESPSQVLASPDGKVLFATQFFVDPVAPPARQLYSFRILKDGSLQHAQRSPAGPNNLPPGASPTMQGVVLHPTRHLAYAALTNSGGIAVFKYDTKGRMTYVGTQPSTGNAPCWMLIDEDGRFLYVVNTASDSVTVFSLRNALRPTQFQDFILKGPRIEPGQANGAATTLARQLAIDPSGDRLYVINQEASATNTFPQGNALHVLDIGSDGLLSESDDPLIFSVNDVPANAHPQGVVAV